MNFTAAPAILYRGDSALDGTTLSLTILFSLIGMGYFAYGKKRDIYFALSGVGLMLFPYFVSSVVGLILIGAALLAVPFLLSRMFPL